MAPKTILLIFIIIPVFAVLAPSEASSGGGMLGGWRPIKNPKGRAVVEIAKFAVGEHNKQENTSLSFVNVIKGETQVVSGTKYKLVVAARDGGAAGVDPKNYIAIVWYKPWQNFKQLLSFGEV